MKIAILQTIHPPWDKRVFHKEAQSLVAAGHEVVSIVPSDTRLPETDRGVRFRPIPEAHSWPQRMRSCLRLVTAGLREKADVYMAVEPESWVSALIIKLLTRRKVVFDVHEYFPTAFAKAFPKSVEGPVVWATRKAMRLMARVTDQIILTKVCLEPDFAGLKTPRTVVLNTNHLQPRCTDIPEKLRNRYEGREVLIHEGIFGTIRGSYELLEAMKLVRRERPQAKCICLGNYEYGDEAAYRRAVADAGMDDSIELPPIVSFEEVPPYVALARAGLILFQPVGLEHTYGMPHKLFDYMREAVPVIGPDYAVEIARVIRESGCGLLIDVTDPQAIADAILWTLDNPDEARLLGENGRRAVEETYHWEADEARLLEVFAAVAADLGFTSQSPH